MAWVDYAKGICIILVVMMWSTYDYGHNVGREGWLHGLSTFAQPFRMPDFFLISGLFLAASIHGPLLDYLDRKLFHFAYFYMLWLGLQLGLTEPGLLLGDPLAFAAMYLKALVVPVNSLWFVYMLAVFYLATRALRHVPRWSVFTLAAVLQISHDAGAIATGWNVADYFCDYYVFFYTGYAAAPYVFAFARLCAARSAQALAGLAAWAAVNGLLSASGFALAPGISLFLGFAGAGAIIATGSLLAGKERFRWLAYAGAHSFVIYLSAFLPMKLMLKLLLAAAPALDVGVACLIITAFAVATPLLFHRLIRGTALGFLYKRPGIFRLGGGATRPLTAAPLER